MKGKILNIHGKLILISGPQDLESKAIGMDRFTQPHNDDLIAQVDW